MYLFSRKGTRRCLICRVSASTLLKRLTVATWFPGLDGQAIRQRFRANLEIGGVPPFWEDRLFSVAETVMQFRIGDVLFEGTNPCQRCVVPSRDAQTGAVWLHFQETFRCRRQESLPEWATLSRFNHFYRLSCNTHVSTTEAGKVLRVGDPISIIGPVHV